MPPRRANPGVIRPIYAGVFDLAPDGYEHARDVALQWLRNNVTVRDRIGDLSDDEFDREVNEVRVQSARNADDTLTVLRLQHPEFDRATRAYDRVRNWRTDITIGRDADGAWIATRQWFKGVASDFRKCYPPIFIKTLWTEKALSDGLILDARCWRPEYVEEIDAIVELVNDEERAMPVVVLAEGCPLDPDRVASESIGLAHVCRVPRHLRGRLNEALSPGQELVHGAIRTFYPRIAGRETVAPAARWETIIGWRYGDDSGPPAFAEWLHAEMSRSVLSRLLNDTAHKTYEDVRTRQIQVEQSDLSARAESVDTLHQSLALMKDERELLLFENESLQEQVTEMSLRTEDLSSQLSIAEQQFGEERAKAIRLEQRILDLQHALARKSGSESITLTAAEVEELIEKQAEPANVLEAVDAANRLFMTYGTKVVFAESAWDSAIESPFMRPGDVLAALLRLGFLWNEVGAGKRREERARELLKFTLALHESDTVVNNKKLMAERRAVAPDGEEVFFEKHLKLGGGPQNDATSLCIYFGDKDGEILIGRVGCHPTGAKTQ